MSEEKFAEFEISVNALGKGQFIVNGQDISNQIRGVQLITQVGELTKVFVDHLTKDFKVKGDGIVYLKPEILPMSTILKSLDHEAIEQEALNRQGWADSKSLVEHILDIVSEQADAFES